MLGASLDVGTWCLELIKQLLQRAVHPTPQGAVVIYLTDLSLFKVRLTRTKMDAWKPQYKLKLNWTNVSTPIGRNRNGSRSGWNCPDTSIRKRKATWVAHSF